MVNRKLIVVKEETYNRMIEILKPIYKETCDQMINKLLDYYMGEVR